MARRVGSHEAAWMSSAVIGGQGEIINGICLAPDRQSPTMTIRYQSVPTSKGCVCIEGGEIAGEVVLAANGLPDMSEPDSTDVDRAVRYIIHAGRLLAGVRGWPGRESLSNGGLDCLSCI